MLAVALLSMATVRSVTMQTADAAGSPPCGMAGMGGAGDTGAKSPARSGPDRQGPDRQGKARAPCEFCSAAAHAPLGADAPRLPAPTLAVWTPAAPVPQLGPRGPPAFAAKARGPPLLA